jgi:nucleoside-diphosphate-sugar epimerase
MKILLTGATGFVGRSLVSGLIATNCNVTALVRERSLSLPVQVVQVAVGDLKNWSTMNSSFIRKMKKILPDVDVVIHLAARVHVMADNSNDPLAEFRTVNTDATLVLAIMAADAGVNRFVYLSSIKVNGESTIGTNPFSDKDCLIPDDPYGVSKFEAEKGLLKIAKETDMEIVIIRPPLVYGPEVKGNFASIINIVIKNYPLPLGSATKNKRSLVALDNLVDFIIFCADYNKTLQAANQIFVLSDGEDVSTAELFHRVAKAYGKKSRLFLFPVSLLRLGAKLLGKKNMSDRLLGSLKVDSTKARDLLGWKPVITMDEQLKKTADAYLKNEKTL